MKFLLRTSLVFLLFFFILAINSQEKASILKYPKDWRLESKTFPLDFASDIKWKGFEELRFSPGMFHRDSPNYFTYYFGIQLEDKKGITKEEIADFLNKNYRGLCKAVNSKRKFSIDYEKIKSVVKRIKRNLFEGEVVFYDSFTNGKEVILKMIITTKKKSKNKLLLLVSVTPEKNKSELKLLHKNNLKNNL